MCIQDYPVDTICAAHKRKCETELMHRDQTLTYERGFFWPSFSANSREPHCSQLLLMQWSETVYAWLRLLMCTSRTITEKDFGLLFSKCKNPSHALNSFYLKYIVIHLSVFKCMLFRMSCTVFIQTANFSLLKEDVLFCISTEYRVCILHFLLLPVPLSQKKKQFLNNGCNPLRSTETLTPLFKYLSLALSGLTPLFIIQSRSRAPGFIPCATPEMINSMCLGTIYHVGDGQEEAAVIKCPITTWLFTDSLFSPIS